MLSIGKTHQETIFDRAEECECGAFKQHAVILSRHLKCVLRVASAVVSLPAFSFLLAEGVAPNSAGMIFNDFWRE